MVVGKKNGECNHRARAEAVCDDYKSKPVGRIVQAAALSLLRTLNSLDTLGVRLDNQYMDQTTVAGTNIQVSITNLVGIFFFSWGRGDPISCIIKQQIGEVLVCLKLVIFFFWQ